MGELSQRLESHINLFCPFPAPLGHSPGNLWTLFEHSSSIPSRWPRRNARGMLEQCPKIGRRMPNGPGEGQHKIRCRFYNLCGDSPLQTEPRWLMRICRTPSAPTARKASWSIMPAYPCGMLPTQRTKGSRNCRLDMASNQDGCGHKSYSSLSLSRSRW